MEQLERVMLVASGDELTQSSSAAQASDAVMRCWLSCPRTRGGRLPTNAGLRRRGQLSAYRAWAWPSRACCAATRTQLST